MESAAKKHRDQKILILILLGLVATFFAMIAVGIAIDSDWLPILGFCGGMPSVFAFLVNLIMYLSRSGEP